MKRRQFLRAVTGSAAVGGLSGRVAAASSLADETPPYVERSYDQDLLERFQPQLVLRDTDETPTLKGYVARSSEHDTTMLSYWAVYTHQDGLTNSDSHLGDHELVVMEVDESSDEITNLYWDGYHWFVARSSTVPTETDSEGMHPKLHVNGRYHFYTTTSTAGAELGVEEFSDSGMQGLIDNGWPIDVRTLAIPWSLSSTSDWWANDVGSVSFEAAIRRVYLTLGWYGGDQASTDLVVS